LDYANARYYSNVTGRFTGVDPFAGSATLANPQSFNRYTYVSNTPVTTVDPSGMGPGVMRDFSDRQQQAQAMMQDGRQFLAEDEAR
jgi:uncharacterized protein RhaS with RHS repeats